MGIEEWNQASRMVRINNYSTKAEELKDVLEINEIQWFKIDFIKNLWYEFHIFWSWSEVLNWENNLKIWDLDIQIVINNKEDKESIVNELKNLWFNVIEITDNQIMATKDGKDYDFHFVKKVNKRDWLPEDGYLEWIQFFPESGYNEKWWIKYIKPEITYIMATNSWKLWNNNRNDIIDIEKQIEKIDEKAIILLDFIEYEIIQKKWKSELDGLSFSEIMKKVKDIVQENDIKNVKKVLDEVDNLSELELKDFENSCVKYRKIQKQAKRINRLKDKIDYDEVERLQWLIWFIKNQK